MPPINIPALTNSPPSIGVWKTWVWATGELIWVVRYPNLMTLQCQSLSFAALRKAKKDIENLLIAGAQSRRRETLVIKSEARSDSLLLPLLRLPITADFCRSKEACKRIASLKKLLDWVFNPSHKWSFSVHSFSVSRGAQTLTRFSLRPPLAVRFSRFFSCNPPLKLCAGGVLWEVRACVGTAVILTNSHSHSSQQGKFSNLALSDISAAWRKKVRKKAARIYRTLPFSQSTSSRRLRVCFYLVADARESLLPQEHHQCCDLQAQNPIRHVNTLVNSYTSRD